VRATGHILGGTGVVGRTAPPVSETFRVRSIWWQAADTLPWVVRSVDEPTSLSHPVDSQRQIVAQPGDYIMRRSDEREEHVIQAEYLWRYYERIDE
jgi:hypothetical protein